MQELFVLFLSKPQSGATWGFYFFRKWPVDVAE